MLESHNNNKKTSLLFCFQLNVFIAQLERNILPIAVKTLQACNISFTFELCRCIHL